MNKPNLARFFKRARLSVEKHSPEILTGIGIAGMLTTTVLAVKATPKALQLIEERKQEGQVDTLPPVEVVKTCWKCYIPAAVTATASVACLIGASSVSARRNAALATAYKLSESAFADYKAKVVETIGEKKEQTVKDKVAQEQLDKNPVSKNEVYITGKGETLFRDPCSKRYFTFDIDKLRKVENKLNRDMMTDPFGYISLNEFYDEIGLERTALGDDIGWNVSSGLIEIHFTPGITDDERPCLVLDYAVAPKYGFDKWA
jgi:hypothetical protein